MMVTSLALLASMSGESGRRTSELHLPMSDTAVFTGTSAGVVVEVFSGAVVAQVLAQPGTDVRVVRDDDDRLGAELLHGRTTGMCCQPRTVDVGASSMPS